jgi:hypothetical protein
VFRALEGVLILSGHEGVGHARLEEKYSPAALVQKQDEVGEDIASEKGWDDHVRGVGLEDGHSDRDDNVREPNGCIHHARVDAATQSAYILSSRQSGIVDSQSGSVLRTKDCSVRPRVNQQTHVELLVDAWDPNGRIEVRTRSPIGRDETSPD